MKFSCYKNDLNEALQFVIRAVAVKPMTPILAGIHIMADGSSLELQGNNYSTGIISRIPASTESPGEVVVSGKRFQDFMRNMPGDTITFSDEEDSSTLKISSGGAEVELMTMDANEFPKVKTPDRDITFTIKTTVLRNLIRKTIFAVAKEETRPVFTGGAFEIKGDKISLVATNTHRLALATDTLTDAPRSDCNFVVPAETLRGLLNRIDRNETNNYIIMDYSTRHLTFTFDNVFVNSRLIEGQFPPYDRVIPTTSTTNVTVDTNDFRSAVELVALMSKETEYNTVRFAFRNGEIEISSNSPEVGEATKTVPAEIDGDDLEISFNVDYILDAVKVIDSNNLHIALNDRYSPAAFTEPENDSYIYVATPVRA